MRPFLIPGALVLLTLAAAATLGACGTPRTDPPPGAGRPAVGPPGARGRFLCTSIDSIDGLVVTRIDAIPRNHLRFVFPDRLSATSPAAARAVARAVCALPPFPKATLNCPADFGISYRLSFAAERGRIRPVLADASGCESVSGPFAPPRWAALAPQRFWTALGHALGLHHVKDSTFAGTGPG